MDFEPAGFDEFCLFFSMTVKQLIIESCKHCRLIDQVMLTAILLVGDRNLENTFISFESVGCVFQRTNHGMTRQGFGLISSRAGPYL